MRVLALPLAAALAAGGCTFNGTGPADDGGPDAPLQDRDGDLIADAVDNCPDRPNPDQHDEDGDLLGDVCDNCPHVANADQANVLESQNGATPDGVGDACDPFPTAGGNEILVFDGFAAASGHWQGTRNGVWQVANDVVTQTSLVGPTEYYYRDLSSNQPIVIETRARILNGNPAGYGVGPVAQYDSGSAESYGYLCQLFDAADPVMLNASMIHLYGSAGSVLSAQLDPTAIQFGQPWQLRLDTNPSSNPATARQSCSARGQSLDLTAQSADAAITQGKIALRARYASVAYEYVVVYSWTP